MKAQRDGIALRGDLILHPTRWARELRDFDRYMAMLPYKKLITEPDQVRRELAALAPPCIDLEHRNGVCPHGQSHDTDEVLLTNTVMDGLYTAILGQFAGVVGSADLAADYVAAGIASTANTNLLTTLGSEYYRAVYTDRQVPSTTSAAVYFFYGTSVANTYLHEFAVFCGAATAAANSGTMACRWLFDFNKSAADTLNGQYLIARA